MPSQADLKAALAKYGYVGTLANSVPELRDLLMRAADPKNKWSVQEFTREVQNTRWWRNSSDSIKQYTILRTTKPGEFISQQNEMIGRVRRVAGQMGVSLSEGQKGTLAQIVRSAMQNGWSDEELRSQVGAHWHMWRGHEAGGDAGATSQKLREVYANYGIPFTGDSIARATQLILMGRTTIDTYVGHAMAAAKSRYAALAPQIDKGMTVKEIASPYVGTMASTLEMPEGQIGLNDTSIQRALTARDDKGQPTVQPLWAFERQLKEDPRWNKTKNAANAAFDTLRKISSDWGFG